MNKLELYIDKNDRLTLDFYMKENDDYPMAVFKGEKCYAIISKLCENKILQIKDNEKAREVYLSFKECVLNISEYEQVLRKKGTGPIKKSISKYYEEEKKQTFEQKKVKRQNKYVGKQIVAGMLVFSVLGSVIGMELSRKSKSDVEEIGESTTYIEETSSSAEEEFTIGNISYEDTNIKQDVKLENLNNVKEEKVEDSSEIQIIIPFEDRSDTEKARITKAYYGDTIEKYAKMYGVDPKIVLAIATQERGIHATKMDPGGATGIMQIQNEVWVNERLTAYNYETQKYETVYVKEADLSDVFKNIRYGCMIFQNCIKYMKGNVLAAIQCYNMGPGNMEDILTDYVQKHGKTLNQVLSNTADCDWINHSGWLRVNGKIYLEHVLSWISAEFDIKSINQDGNIVEYKITNQESIKVK